jgi:hypothetical protein
VLRPLADPTVTSQGLRVRLEQGNRFVFWKTQAFQNPSLIYSAIMRDETRKESACTLNIIDTAGKVSGARTHAFCGGKTPFSAHQTQPYP